MELDVKERGKMTCTMAMAKSTKTIKAVGHLLALFMKTL
jgi:hypothetical protein